ncbi:uncharacterized protein LOC141531940 [Cotesia typhae]|uniref:uncharacterized protein LOC141531940 n=1 Tax=Cotesia typhae TaxID=2053667 RepID=UPI003D688817
MYFVKVELSDNKSPANYTIKVEYKCVLCEASLESKEALQVHFRKHANKEIDARGKPFASKPPPTANDSACDICGKSFQTIAATIRHRFKIHPNSPAKFYCGYCGMQFPLKTHRDAHVTSHDTSDDKSTTEEHEKCEECNVVFYNKKALNYHYKSVHKRLVHMFQPIATPPPSNKIKVNSMNDALSVYYCHLCGVEYIVKFNLQQHLERVHSPEEREAVPSDLIKCTMCSAFFYSKKAYDTHNSYHQPDDLYVTSEEQRLQTITKIDQDFDIRRVKPRTEKYIPKSLSRKSSVNRQNYSTVNVKVKSEPESNSSDSESDIPLNKRLKS